MIAPAFSSEKTNINFRLFFSVAISLLIAPLIADTAISNLDGFFNYSFLLPVIHELIIGIYYGAIYRFYFSAIDEIITSFCYTIGLSNIFDTGFTDLGESLVLSSFINISCLQLFFITELHCLIIEGIANSYELIPIQQDINPVIFLKLLTESLSQSFLLVLRVCSPLLLFAVTINLSFALLARLTPNTPIFFISGPGVIFLGIIFFYDISPDLMAGLVLSLRAFITGH